MPLAQQTMDAANDRLQLATAARSKCHEPRKTSMARYVAYLLISSTACAYAQTPSVTSHALDSAKETPTMTTPASTNHPHQTPPVPPKLSAEQVLLRLLELIRGSKNIHDFTPEYISKVMGVPVTTTSGNNYGYGEDITPDWAWGIEMQTTASGARQLDFRFGNDPGTNPPIKDICQLDYNRFTKDLEKMNFTRDQYHVEHRIILYEYFLHPNLRVEVYSGPALTEAPENEYGQSCVKMVLVN